MHWEDLHRCSTRSARANLRVALLVALTIWLNSCVLNVPKNSFQIAKISLIVQFNALANPSMSMDPKAQARECDPLKFVVPTFLKPPEIHVSITENVTPFKGTLNRLLE